MKTLTKHNIEKILKLKLIIDNKNINEIWKELKDAIKKVINTSLTILKDLGLLGSPKIERLLI